MAANKAFPSITGGCLCDTIRYRLLTSPLFCYACHCTECRTFTGSAFSLVLKIEMYNIKVISPTLPTFFKSQKQRGIVVQQAECPKCHVHLWSTNGVKGEEAVYEVRVGTLDFAELMEPDVHIFVQNKLEWVILPESARTLPRGVDMRKFWPKSSLARLEKSQRWAAEVKKRGHTALVDSRGVANTTEEGGVDDAGGEGDKTPTALEFSNEDDEEFEKKVKEKERLLLERLEKLRLKLDEEETSKTAHTNTESADSDPK
ncbi:uncharacterized protein yc1106_05630 [Curvularia clavata]|uniref:CENP-V/GFA domain-containing protein n=1 Tax=Curvularia clavata TaxID=95742 RepID=A0A9Q8Z8E9_CURCL|nr:uncharacterized protein yc1106_05630 [Curvularia clavata]